VKKIDELSENSMKVQRMTEEGYDVLEVQIPCLLTVVKEINTPRVPSFKGKMKAKKAEIQVWGKNDLELDDKYLGLDGSPTQVVKIFSPAQKDKGGKIFSIDQVDEAVREIAEALQSSSVEEEKEEVTL